ncbi:hypothetical protein THAOC_17423, partial [Thalassiosira oceanica]
MARRPRRPMPSSIQEAPVPRRDLLAWLGSRTPTEDSERAEPGAKARGSQDRAQADQPELGASSRSADGRVLSFQSSIFSSMSVSSRSAPIFAIFAVSMATTSAFLHHGLPRPHASNNLHHGLSRPHASNNLLLSKGGPANDGPVFYDDFGESELNSKSEREDRMLQLQMDKAATKVKEGEIAYESKIARNWRRGNWSV